MDKSTVLLDGHNLGLHDVWQISTEKKQGHLSIRAREAMRESRALVEKLVGEDRAIYGINTGFGPLSSTRIDRSSLHQHQLNLLHHLSVGQGSHFSVQETRAIMLSRANALARGFSGIREEVVDLLLEALNRNILPVIPREGSVGASGDLVPLAHMARMLVGLGQVIYDGQKIDVQAAFEKNGLKAVVLEAKEGLALVNGTSVMTGLTALAAFEAGALLKWMELFSAFLFEIFNAEPEVLCEQIHKARGFRGQYSVANRITVYLKSNSNYREQIDDHSWGSYAKPMTKDFEIQDAYSIRCIPQILGAFQEALWHIEQIVTRELNASTDNPLIFPDTGTVIHGGNFYGQQISMANDYLRIGLAKLALLADRQIDRMLNWRYSKGLPPLLTGAEPGLNSGMAGCQILATSLAAECRILCTPASVQTIPTNANNQDVVSMGCTSAKMTREILQKLWTIISVKALAIAQAADLRKESSPSEIFCRFHQAIRHKSAKLEIDRPLFEDVKEVTLFLQSEEAQQDFLG